MRDEKRRRYNYKLLRTIAVENAAYAVQKRNCQEVTPPEIVRKNKSETRIRQQIFYIISKGIREGLSKDEIIAKLRERPGTKQFEQYFDTWIKDQSKNRDDEER